MPGAGTLSTSTLGLSTSTLDLTAIGGSSTTIETVQSRKEADRKKRSKNWTSDEKAALVQAVSLVHKSLLGKFSQTVSDARKDSLWASIANQVNAVSTVKRDVKSIKSQFTDLKSRTKGKAVKLLKEVTATGGGELDLSCMTMDDIELRIASLEKSERDLVRLIGKEGLAGIEGGLETNLPNSAIDLEVGFESPQEVISSQRSQHPGPSTSLEVWNPEVPETAANKGGKTSTEKKKLKKLKPEDVLQNKMIATQDEILAHVKRIADAQEELVRLKKIKYSQL